MSDRALRQLFREWAAILAVFAMVLGPLGAAVARGLTTSDRIAVAAGLTPPPLCIPGDTPDSTTGLTLHGCDHCLPLLGSAPPCPETAATTYGFVERLQPADTGPSTLLAQLRLPPATGPPTT